MCSLVFLSETTRAEVSVTRSPTLGPLTSGCGRVWERGRHPFGCMWSLELSGRGAPSPGTGGAQGCLPRKRPLAAEAIWLACPRRCAELLSSSLTSHVSCHGREGRDELYSEILLGCLPRRGETCPTPEPQCGVGNQAQVLRDY